MKITIGGTTKRSKFQREVELDWDGLPEESRNRMIEYGLKQYLADGVASAESESDFNAGIDERLRKLREADFKRAHGEKGPTDDPETLAKSIARENVVAGTKGQGFDKAYVTELVDAYFTAHKDALMKEAEARIAKRKAMAESVLALIQAKAKEATGA